MLTDPVQHSQTVHLESGQLSQLGPSPGTLALISSRTVQNYSRLVLPRLFVIPKLDAFDHATFTGEANDLIFSSRPDSASKGQLLRRAISKVGYDTVEENNVAYAKLKSVKGTGATRNLN